MNTKRHRTCSACKESKLLSEFIRNRSKDSGRTYMCRPCQRIYDAQKREEKKAIIKKHAELFKFLNRRRPAMPVARYTMDGKFIDSFKSAREAAEKLGINMFVILKVARNPLLSYKGYKWKHSLIGNNNILDNAACNCCGKLVEKDLMVHISLECVRELNEYRRAKLL